MGPTDFKVALFTMKQDGDTEGKVERRKEEEVEKNCTMKPNKVVFNDLFPCPVEFCCGGKCS